MENRRFLKLIKKIFVLRPKATLFIALPSFVLVTYVLVNIKEQNALCYIAYIMSAYSMIILITGFRGIFNAVINLPLVKKLYSQPAVKRYLIDAFFRTEVSLYQGLFINILFATGKLLFGIFLHSLWFEVLSIYYFLLILLRLSLILYVRKYPVGENLHEEFLRYKNCGIMLLFMNLALVVITAMIVYKNEYFYYPGYLIYAMAFYAFYSITIAIINLVKFRKQGSPVMSAAKVINLTTAAVSMLSLTTAMIATFSDDAEGFRRLMTSLVGGGVCFFVFVMAIYMILHTRKMMKKISS